MIKPPGDGEPAGSGLTAWSIAVHARENAGFGSIPAKAPRPDRSVTGFPPRLTLETDPKAPRRARIDIHLAAGWTGRRTVRRRGTVVTWRTVHRYRCCEARVGFAKSSADFFSPARGGDCSWLCSSRRLSIIACGGAAAIASKVSPLDSILSLCSDRHTDALGIGARRLRVMTDVRERCK